MDEAYKEWVEHIDLSEILGEKIANSIDEIDTDLAPLDGLMNIWCSTLYIAEKFALVHIVETVEWKRIDPVV